MHLAAHLAAIDALRARPGSQLATLYSGDDLRACDLDDAESLCQALIELLAHRWGDPETLDLTPHLHASAAGNPVPAPLDQLCGYVGEVYGWRVDGRWTGLGVSDQDPEFPVQLIAATGDAAGLR